MFAAPETTSPFQPMRAVKDLSPSIVGTPASTLAAFPVRLSMIFPFQLLKDTALIPCHLIFPFSVFVP